MKTYKCNININFFSVDITKEQLLHKIITKLFVYSRNVKQVFFVVDET